MLDHSLGLWLDPMLVPKWDYWLVPTLVLLWDYPLDSLSVPMLDL